jgi:CxxC-x17-CxxC domain-containing protein
MIDGVSSDPFSADTLPPLYDDYRTDSREKVVNVSRERYSNRREVVEDKINRWSGMGLSQRLGEISSAGEEYEMGEVVTMKETVAGPTISLSSLGQGAAAMPPKFSDRDRRPDGRAKPPKESRPPRREDESFTQAVDMNRAVKPSLPNLKERQSPDETELFDARCTLCHRDFKLKFKPEMGRPVYCDDCFKKVRNERRKKTEARDQRVAMIEGDVALRPEAFNTPTVSLADLLPKSQNSDTLGKDEILDELEIVRGDK